MGKRLWAKALGIASGAGSLGGDGAAVWTFCEEMSSVALVSRAPDQE
jgi:hypothetical protein